MRTQVVPVPLADAWSFFAAPANLEAITPPWLRFRIVSAPATLQRGSFLRYRLRLVGWPLDWLTVITEWNPPRSFTDVQLDGPYALWEHTHRLVPTADGTEIHDHVRYRVREGLAAPLAELVVGRALAAIFDFRARRARELLT